MRKTIIPLAAALCGLTAFTACGKTGSSASSSGGASSVDESGNDPITFFNNLLAFRKEALEPLKKIVAESEKSEEFITYTPGKPMWNLVLGGVSPYNKIAKSNLAAPKSFSSADQDYINSRIKLAREGCDELNKIVATLITYYKAEDYKDDKHKKFLDTKPRIQALVQQVATSCNEALGLADKISEAAERKILEKSPTGPCILAMRDIMAKCSEQMDILTHDRLIRVGSGTAYTDKSKAEAAAKVTDLSNAADAMTAEINKLAEKAKAINRDAIKNDAKKTRAYDDFFKAVEDEQAVIRKTIRHIREWGNVGDEGDMRNLRGNLRHMTDAHNRFLN